MINKKPISIAAQIAYNEKDDKFSTFLLPAPFSVCYKITQRCNYSCPHCISGSTCQSDYGLSTQKVKDLFDHVYKAGVLRLDITGGEPYIRNDINELLEYGCDLGLEMVITTNGSLLTDEDIEVLSRNHIFTQISLDGNKELNDKLRGKGTFDTATKAIKRLQDKGVPIRINCTLQQANCNALQTVLEIAKEYDVHNVYAIIACAQGGADYKRQDICLSSEEEEKVRMEILRLRQESNINVKLLDFKQYAHACVLIETNGDFIAQSWDQNECVTTGNLFEQNLNELWMNSNAFDHIRHLLQYLRHPLLYI